jgi:quercetin dioxygenase-like cupin family protein
MHFRKEGNEEKPIIRVDRSWKMINMEKSRNHKPKAARLVDLIDYQEASVVSRTLINKKAGTVTLFAFDERQGLSEHTAPYDAMAQIIEGEAEMSLSDKLHQLRAGEMIIMPANAPHSLKAKGKFKMLLTMIRS